MSASLIVRDRLDNLRAVTQKLEALNKLPGSSPHWRRKVALNPYQILLLEVDETRRRLHSGFCSIITCSNYVLIKLFKAAVFGLTFVWISLMCVLPLEIE